MAIAVEVLRPDGEGTYTTGALGVWPGGAPHWDALDEETADGNSSYVYSSTAAESSGGAKESYTLGDHVEGSGLIGEIRIGGVFRDNSGTADHGLVKLTLLTGGEEYPPEGWTTITASWAGYSRTLAVNPSTGQPWTWEELDGLEVGIILARPDSAEMSVRCTQLYVEVEHEPGIALTPAAPAGAAVSAGAPVVVHGSLALTPEAAIAAAAGLGPGVVHGSLELSPEAAGAAVGGLGPVVVLGSAVALPAEAAAKAAMGDPEVVLGDTTAAPEAATAAAGCQAPGLDVRSPGHELEVLRPSGAGYYSLLSRSGGTANWACVDEASQDGDSSYVYTTTSYSQGGRQDTYNLQNHAEGSGPVHKVTLKAYARDTYYSGSGGLKFRLRVSSTDYVESTWRMLGNSYSLHSLEYLVNPRTGQGWTWEEIDSLEAGYSIGRPYGGGAARVTQFWVEVDYGSPGLAVLPAAANAAAGSAGPDAFYSSVAIVPEPAAAKVDTLGGMAGVPYEVSPAPATAATEIQDPAWTMTSISFSPAAPAAAVVATPAPVFRVINVTVIALSLRLRPAIGLHRTSEYDYPYPTLTVGERPGVHLVERWLLEDGSGHWLWADKTAIVLGIGLEGTKFYLWPRSTALTLEERDE